VGVKLRTMLAASRVEPRLPGLASVEDSTEAGALHSGGTVSPETETTTAT
jgi:hypothetical protein